MKDKKLWLLTEGLCLLPVLVSIYYESRLPERVPSHWDFAGQVNGTLPKLVFIFLLPVLFAVIHLIIFPSAQKIRPSGFRIFLTWLMPVLSMLLQTIITVSAVGVGVNMRLVATVIVSTIFIIVGNYLPKELGVKRNLPRQHATATDIVLRTLGFLFVVEGFVLMVTLLISPIASMVSLGIFVVLVFYFLFGNR